MEASQFLIQTWLFLTSFILSKARQLVKYPGYSDTGRVIQVRSKQMRMSLLRRNALHLYEL